MAFLCMYTAAIDCAAHKSRRDFTANHNNDPASLVRLVGALAVSRVSRCKSRALLPYVAFSSGIGLRIFSVSLACMALECESPSLQCTHSETQKSDF
eukprot:2490081-Amphidinium_carterae.1